MDESYQRRVLDYVNDQAIDEGAYSDSEYLNLADVDINNAHHETFMPAESSQEINEQVEEEDYRSEYVDTKEPEKEQKKGEENVVQPQSTSTKKSSSKRSKFLKGLSRGASVMQSLVKLSPKNEHPKKDNNKKEAATQSTTTTTQSKPARHEGFLWKKGQLRKNWKRRWFVLEGGILKYYKAPVKSARLLGALAVKGNRFGSCTAISPQYEFNLQIVTKSRVFFFYADNMENLKGWKDSITEQGGKWDEGLMRVCRINEHGEIIPISGSSFKVSERGSILHNEPPPPQKEVPPPTPQEKPPVPTASKNENNFASSEGEEPFKINAVEVHGEVVFHDRSKPNGWGSDSEESSQSQTRPVNSRFDHNNPANGSQFLGPKPPSTLRPKTVADVPKPPGTLRPKPPTTAPPENGHIDRMQGERFSAEPWGGSNVNNFHSTPTPPSGPPPQRASIYFQQDNGGSHSSNTRSRPVPTPSYNGGGGGIGRQSVFNNSRIFGVPIEQVAKENDVPVVIEQTIRYLEEYGLQEEGILRLAGSAVKCKQLKADYDSGTYPDLWSCNDISTVGSLLKLYLRELPRPLIPLSATLREASDQENPVETIKQEVQRMNTESYLAARRLFFFLNLISQYSEYNKMVSNNLAIVFSPTLRLRMEAIVIMIDYAQTIFE